MTKSTADKRKSKVRKSGVLLLMMLPGIFYLVINNYLPMFGVVIAFKDFNYTKGIFGSDWVGFKNFEYLFKTSDAFVITRNTILYNGVFIILNLFIAVGLAVLLNEVKQRFLSRFYQSVILLPYLISMVIIGYLTFAVFSMDSGLLNKSILPMFGISEISWYSEAKYWPYILTFVHSWKSAGYLCVIYLAAIIGIDQEYYEAATIDGAGKWRQIKSITFPLIMPVVTVMTLLQIGRIFYSDFGLFYQVPLNTGALQSTTNVIDTYVYRALMTLGDIGMSSAAGLYQSLVGFVLVFISNYVVKKFNSDNALF
ncbi:sugar ABC transporter permease [Bacillus sp. FJAT-27264]|uniref:Sugar ABC transporter permease n=1 Tax=Paenibacillus agri TaxID=2744309 RepID=A0A850EL92_9BACL|nr:MULTISPECIES: ABC transporter permease subunit [Bacillales]NUU59332.1 sugar ABC transporter permease [Paenibacillus agri]OBZ19293.1 sugar ABC transporter permease [Bacillus sp. FJAT-27264]